MKLEGKNATREAILTDKVVDKIIVQNGSNNKELVALAKEKGIKVQFADKNVLDGLSETGHHQGIIAFSSEFNYSSVEEILNFAKSKNEDVFVLVLDEIMDPHNLGSILRVAECAGVHGVIIPKDRAVCVNETVVRVSAGASERIKVARVTNLNRAVEQLKENNVFVYVADMDGELMYNVNLKGNIAIVVGSEGFGVGKLTKKIADGVVKIPMYGKINSLNASVSTGIVAYEVVRQRGKF